MQLQEYYQKLNNIYCKNVGYDIGYLSNQEQKDWIFNQIENEQFYETTKETKLKILKQLQENYILNDFLQTKFPQFNRKGNDGLDSTIIALQTILQTCIQEKIETLVLGSPPRGRLNTLGLIAQKPFEQIMVEIQEKLKNQNQLDEKFWMKMGDTIHNMPFTKNLKDSSGNSLTVQILPSSSVLESQGPFLYGKIRSIQDNTQDFTRKKNIGILIHGDAAHAGQGVVYETYEFQDLENYTSGGNIHIIMNNQIGFTTIPKDEYSGLFCSEIAKTIMAPIVHVNADDPEMVEKIAKMSFEFRQKFGKDFIIDIIGYRRYGENVQDDPFITQPLMYQKINQHPDTYTQYYKKLIQEGIISEEQIQKQQDKFRLQLSQALEKASENKFHEYKQPQQPYEIIKKSSRNNNFTSTGLSMRTLKSLGKKISKIPSQISPHPQVSKIYSNRFQSISDGNNIDFALAESLAFVSLLNEGYGIRLTGQDVERGTFSHRHSIVHDQNAYKLFRPIDNGLDEKQQKKYVVSNSTLSEYANLSFEYGYSAENPGWLVLWEAQFGDFVNNAQISVDNYITSGESKWSQQSGLVLLLPHGMDGNGPEHSSARLERFLQLSDDDYELQNNYRDKSGKMVDQIRQVNIQVGQMTTASNLFHFLRRQVRREVRKPLILMVNKKLLKSKHSVSNLSEFESKKSFVPVYADNLPEEKIRKVLICSGQVYFDLLDRRNQQKITDTAIIRLEELCPFPYDALQSELQKYPFSEIKWVQEEHMNQGAWRYVKTRIPIVLKNLERMEKIDYIGRPLSSSSATGYHRIHIEELNKFLQEAFSE